MGVVFIFAILAVILIILFMIKSSLAVSKGGKILAFLAFLIFPVLALGFGTMTHLDNSKTIAFCTSCHVMNDYAESLYIDDPDNLPAVHFQNNGVSQKEACYKCHTTYTPFGDLEIKLTGMVHVIQYYLGKYPENIHLHKPFNNRECLHCHGNARSFLTDEKHKSIMQKLTANEVFCLSCHSYKHDIENLDKHTFWEKPEK